MLEGIAVIRARMSERETELLLGDDRYSDMTKTVEVFRLSKAPSIDHVSASLILSSGEKQRHGDDNRIPMRDLL